MPLLARAFADDISAAAVCCCCNTAGSSPLAGVLDEVLPKAQARAEPHGGRRAAAAAAREENALQPGGRHFARQVFLHQARGDLGQDLPGVRARRECSLRFSSRFPVLCVLAAFACLRALGWVGAGREDRVADRSFVFRFCVCMCATRRCAALRPALPASIRTIRGRGGKSTTGFTRRRSTTSSSASRTVRSSKTRRPRASSRRDKLGSGWVGSMKAQRAGGPGVIGRSHPGTFDIARAGVHSLIMFFLVLCILLLHFRCLIGSWGGIQSPTSWALLASGTQSSKRKAQWADRACMAMHGWVIRGPV